MFIQIVSLYIEKQACITHISPSCLFDLILYVPSTIYLLCRNRSSWVEPVLGEDKCILLKTQHNDAGEARTRGPSVSSLHPTTEPLCLPISCSCWYGTWSWHFLVIITLNKRKITTCYPETHLPLLASKYIIFTMYTHVQWKRTTYKSDYIFLTTWHLIFAIASNCSVAIP